MIFFNNYLFSKFINKCQKEILRCAPPSSQVCDFFSKSLEEGKLPFQSECQKKKNHTHARKISYIEANHKHYFRKKLTLHTITNSK